MKDKEMFKGLKCCASMGKMCNLCPYFYLQDCTSRLCQDMFDHIKRLNAERKELQSSIAALDCALDISNNKPYRKKFLEEVWEGEMGNKLSEPDSDLIYELYFKEREKNEQIRKDTAKEILDEICNVAYENEVGDKYIDKSDWHSIAEKYGVEVGNE